MSWHSRTRKANRLPAEFEENAAARKLDHLLLYVLKPLLRVVQQFGIALGLGKGSERPWLTRAYEIA